MSDRLEQRLLAVLTVLGRICESQGECLVVRQADSKVLCKIPNAYRLAVIQQHFNELAEMGYIRIDEVNDPNSLGWTVSLLVDPKSIRQIAA